MTGDVVNLRRARKVRARAAQETVAAANRAAHGRSRAFTGHDHPAPRLAVADGRSVLREIEQMVDERRFDGIGAEAPHVAAPGDELAEAAAERRIEQGGTIVLGFGPRWHVPSAATAIGRTSPYALVFMTPSYRTLPGFRIPLGSSVCLMARIVASATGSFT